MGKLVFIMGKSGTGKSRSMKNLPADRFALINAEGKDLPFGKDAPAFRVEKVVSDNSNEIVNWVKTFSRKYSIIVIDDFQAVMTNEYMRRSSETGYQKWTDIGKHAWEITEVGKKLPDDVILYVLCHTEENDQGEEKIKTLGKLLDQNVVLESKSTIVLKTGVQDGQYFFTTQNNGKDTVKSPEGMFPSYAIQNDLQYVDDCIRSYYDLPTGKSDAELAEEHITATIDDIRLDTGRRTRRREEAPAEPQRKRTRAEVQAENDKRIDEYMEALDQAAEFMANEKGEIPFEEASIAEAEIPLPEIEKLPRRTREEKEAEEEAKIRTRKVREEE